MASKSWQDMVKQDKESRTPAPAGRYVMEIVKADLGTKKNNADVPQWRLVCQVAEGSQKGKAAFLYLTFDPQSNALRMSFDRIRQVGIDPGAHDFLDPEAKTAFIGRRFEAELSTREYNGNLSNEIKNIVKPLTSGAPSSVGAPPPASAPAAPKNPLAKPKAI